MHVIVHRHPKFPTGKCFRQFVSNALRLLGRSLKIQLQSTRFDAYVPNAPRWPR